jgi:DNA (cytosine-5)-methyltransferase 1
MTKRKMPSADLARIHHRARARHETLHRREPQFELRLQDELIVDLFAGGGGTSTGIEMACGFSPDIAANHDPEAVAMHTLNHPHTKHYCENVVKLDIQKVCGGRPVGLLWLSPDCTFHSKARGGKPFRDRNHARRRRGLAWEAIRWAKAVRPRIICLENVEEFEDWGPLGDDGKPDPLKKGATFQRWMRQLQNLGYAVEYWELKGCDYGAPTIRKRLFLVARCDGQPIVKPVQTHGDPKSEAVKAGLLLPWRTTAECIDWKLACPSIFERSKPLAENTLKRIATGIFRYVINTQKPFIVPVTHAGDSRVNDIDAPMPTITSAHRGEKALVAANIARIGQTGGGPQVKGATDPLSTITTKAEHLLVGANLVGVGGRAGQSRPRSLDEPAATVTSKYDTAVVAPFVTKFRENSVGSKIDEPLHTITTGGGGGNSVHGIVAPIMVTSAHGEVSPKGVKRWGKGHRSVEEPHPTITTSGSDHSLVASTLIQSGYGEREGQVPRTADLEAPANTIVAGGVKQGLVAALLNKHYGGVVGTPIDQPAGTVTTSDHHALTTATLLHNTTGNAPTDPREPLKTITTGGQHAVVASHLAELHGTSSAHPVDTPLGTVAAQGTHHAEVRTFLMKYYGQGGQWSKVSEPMGAITTKDRMALVNVDGAPYEIVDIGMRMLQPRELYRAQGFPDNYKIDVVHNGKPFTKEAQVRMVGNSVCPQLAAAILRANFQFQPRQLEAA